MRQKLLAIVAIMIFTGMGADAAEGSREKVSDSATRLQNAGKRLRSSIADTRMTIEDATIGALESLWGDAERAMRTDPSGKNAPSAEALGEISRRLDNSCDNVLALIEHMKVLSDMPRTYAHCCDTEAYAALSKRLQNAITDDQDRIVASTTGKDKPPVFPDPTETFPYLQEILASLQAARSLADEFTSLKGSKLADEFLAVCKEHSAKAEKDLAAIEAGKSAGKDGFMRYPGPRNAFSNWRDLLRLEDARLRGLEKHRTAAQNVAGKIWMEAVRLQGEALHKAIDAANTGNKEAYDAAARSVRDLSQRTQELWSDLERSDESALRCEMAKDLLKKYPALANSETGNRIRSTTTALLASEDASIKARSADQRVEALLAEGECRINLVKLENLIDTGDEEGQMLTLVQKLREKASDNSAADLARKIEASRLAWRAAEDKLLDSKILVQELENRMAQLELKRDLIETTAESLEESAQKCREDLESLLDKADDATDSDNINRAAATSKAANDASKIPLDSPVDKKQAP